MYRTAAKRLLCSARQFNGNAALRFRRHNGLITYSRFSTTEINQPFSNPHSIHDAIPISTTEIENPTLYDSTSSSTSSSSTTDEDSHRFKSPKSKTKYEDEHARLLSASLVHVVRTLTLFLFIILFSIFFFLYLDYYNSSCFVNSGFFFLFFFFYR